MCLKNLRKNDMENKNLTIVVGLLVFIVGLILGYFFGSSTILNYRGFFPSNFMGQEMIEYMHGNGFISNTNQMEYTMTGMMSQLEGLEGEKYEEMFLREMIVHHVGAVQMAEELLKQTKRPELQTFANDIIEVQSQEIKMMETWLELWFNQ